jgi:predicted Zn-dependent protease
MKSAVSVLVLAVGALRVSPARAAAPPADAAARALRTGNYDQARRLCDARLARVPDDRGALLTCVKAEEARGLYAEARRRLEAAAEARPADLAVRDALMRLYDATGARAALAPLIAASYDDWSAGRIDHHRPAELVAIATAVRLDDNWKDASDVLREAVLADRHDVAANLDWGAVLLEKHNATDAEASFREILRTDPANPDAHLGLGRVALEDRYDAEAARLQVSRALAVNAAHAGALALRAELALDAEDFDAARADVAAIRRTNPRDPGAARLAAAAALLLDDRDGFARARDIDLGVHPRDGRFFAFVAEALSRQRRYEDARAVAEEGVATDPDDAACLSTLATTLLRLGEEGPGLETLRRAWKRDPYNLRTYNLLDLFEKVIPADYVTIASAHLRFRIEPATRAAIEEVVAPFLEERYRAYVARYGFEPRGPVTFELYGDPRHFAVRTVGLPTIGVSGVCFGRVITSQAPTNRAFNWGMVLSHELAHVFAIELSRGRVPRWFTEGLSEVETMHARPEWTRHDDIALYGAWRRGELPPLAALSNAFVNARSADEATRAYAQAALAVDFLERRFGFAAIRSALVAYGRGARGVAVLQQLAGRPAAELESAFRASLAERFAVYDRQYLPAQSLGGASAPPERSNGLPAEGSSGVHAQSSSATSAARWTVAGRSAHDDARRGVASLGAGDLEGARRALAAARAVSHPSTDDQADTLFLTGEIALARRDADAAVASFEGLLDVGPPSHDGYDVRVRLGLAEIHRQHQAAAEDQLRRAAEFDPTRVEPHALLAELYGAEQRATDQIAELEAALRLDPQTDAIAKQIVLAEARAGRPARVAEFAAIAIFIDPADPDLHAALGRALAATGQPAAGAAALERALALHPSDPTALHLTLAALYGALGDHAKAAAHRAAAGR